MRWSKEYLLIPRGDNCNPLGVNYERVGGQVPTPGKDYTILIDYAHSPDGMVNMLSSVKGFAKGRTVALFGCGDSESYPDTFVGGMGELYQAVVGAGAHVVGAVPVDGYTFDASDAVVDGHFVGLALDEVNESDKTDARIDAWAALLPRAGITPAVAVGL